MAARHGQLDEGIDSERTAVVFPPVATVTRRNVVDRFVVNKQTLPQS